uniref:Uncharacterized protein n=1 Tax=Ditylum brightwellii TaxID=49249 RepID=A0A6V2DJM7_9STRA
MSCQTDKKRGAIKNLQGQERQPSPNVSSPIHHQIKQAIYIYYVRRRERERQQKKSNNMRIIVVPVIFLAVTTLSTSFLTGFSPQPHVHYPPSSSSTTRSFLRDSVDPDRRWQQEQWLVYGYRPNKNGNTKTALCMGFRSFIKKRILRKNDGDEYETENDTVTDEQMDALIDEMSPEEFDILEDDDVDTDGGKSDGAAVADASSRSNEQDSRPSSSRNYESTKERIQRVKSGQMTEEEKAAFLNTAMTRINNPKKRKGPPIRQPIPVEGSGGSNKGTTSPASSPSPYPTDSLWSEIMGGRSSDDGNQKGGLTGYKSGQKLNENEKRRYFEMVTNPNRFKKNTPSSAGDGAKETTNTVPSPSVRNEKQETAPAAAPIEVEVPTKAEKKKEETTIANDLGTRLGAAAILKEKQDAENRRKMEQKRKEEEEQAKAAAAEVQRKLLEETRRQQEEAAAKKAAIEEARLKEEQKRKAAEEEQKKKLQAVQDEYWKKKFEEEKAKKENLITNEERAKAEEEKKKKAEIEQKRKMREAAEEKQRLMLKEEAKVREEKKAADNLTQVSWYIFHSLHACLEKGLFSLS